MKKYKVNVDGETFIVSVREIEVESETSEQSQQIETTVERKIEESSSKPEPVNSGVTKTNKVKDTESVDGDKVLASLPGQITSIEVNEGDQVKKGEVLFVHEAMKMENEINSPVAGTIKVINVSEGEQVETDQLLAIIG